MLSVYFYWILNRMNFQTPPLYFIIHILLGMISYFYPIIILLFLVYQFTQLALNGRFFLFEWEFKPGNSFAYTLYKIAQYTVGYTIVYVYSVCD
jgi:hypothetical protein